MVRWWAFGMMGCRGREINGGRGGEMEGWEDGRRVGRVPGRGTGRDGGMTGCYLGSFQFGTGLT